MSWSSGGKRVAGELIYRTRMDGAGKMESEAVRAERSLDKMEGATGRASGGLFTLQGALMAAGGAFCRAEHEASATRDGSGVERSRRSYVWSQHCPAAGN